MQSKEVQFDRPDLGFSVLAEVHEYRVEFRVFSIFGEDVDGHLLWVKNGDSSMNPPTETPADAEVYLHGDVKWDGCSNWAFDEQDRCMLHGCSRENLLALGEIMAFCWDLTAELCPKWYR